MDSIVGASGEREGPKLRPCDSHSLSASVILFLYIQEREEGRDIPHNAVTGSNLSDPPVQQ